MQDYRMTGEKIALIGGGLIDGCGGEPIDNSVVLISGNVIQEVGDKDKVIIPNGYKSLNVAGKTVMPGMIDLHVHLCWGEDEAIRWRAGILPPLLESPLTLVGIKGFARARRSLAKSASGAPIMKALQREPPAARAAAAVQSTFS